MANVASDTQRGTQKITHGEQWKRKELLLSDGDGQHSLGWAFKDGRFVNIGGGQGRLLAKQNECEQDRKEVKAC